MLPGIRLQCQEICISSTASQETSIYTKFQEGDYEQVIDFNLGSLLLLFGDYWGTGFQGAQLNWEAFSFLQEALGLHRT